MLFIICDLLNTVYCPGKFKHQGYYWWNVAWGDLNSKVKGGTINGGMLPENSKSRIT